MITILGKDKGDVSENILDSNQSLKIKNISTDFSLRNENNSFWRIFYLVLPELLL